MQDFFHQQYWQYWYIGGCQTPGDNSLGKSCSHFYEGTPVFNLDELHCCNVLAGPDMSTVYLCIRNVYKYEVDISSIKPYWLFICWLFIYFIFLVVYDYISSEYTRCVLSCTEPHFIRNRISIQGLLLCIKRLACLPTSVITAYHKGIGVPLLKWWTKSSVFLPSSFLNLGFGEIVPHTLDTSMLAQLHIFFVSTPPFFGKEKTWGFVGLLEFQYLCLTTVVVYYYLKTRIRENWLHNTGM